MDKSASLLHEVVALLHVDTGRSADPWVLAQRVFLLITECQPKNNARHVIERWAGRRVLPQTLGGQGDFVSVLS